jgi:hypothetical protein
MLWPWMSVRVVRLVRAVELERVYEPYIKHIEDRIWEMRLRGRNGIAWALYVTATGRGVVILRVREEDPEDPGPRNRAGAAACEGGDMSRKNIPAGESFVAWRKDPEHVKAYNALEAGGTLENAQAMAAHESPRTTKLYDRTDDAITLDEVERITI